MTNRAFLAALGGALTLLAAASAADTPVREPVKVSPLTLAVGFSASVAPDVEAAQRASAWALFDRDTAAAHLPWTGGTSWVDLDLGADVEVEAVKVYGSASFWLTVYELEGGRWVMVPGLNTVSLDTAGTGWARLAANRPVATRQLRLEFRPRPVKGAPQPVRELEVWAGGTIVPVAGGRHLRQLVDVGLTPPHALALAAAPAELEPGTGHTTATVSLPVDPRLVKRAYLAYDAFPVAAWVSAARTINGLTLTGGFPTLTATNWVVQVEAVPPGALRPGENRIEFRAGAAGAYRARNVRLLAELDSGSNFVTLAAARTVSGDYVAADPLFDGDVTSGVAPRGQTLEWRFDEATEAEALRLFVQGSLKGEAYLAALRGTSWEPLPTGYLTLQLDTLAPGWSAVPLPRRLGPIQGLRLTLPTAGPRDPPGQLTEARIIGSVAGSRADRRGIHVAGPEEGEFYGRRAFLVGWLAPWRVDTGTPALYLDGKKVDGVPVAADGAFSLAVSKDAGPYAGQPDDAPWAATLKAVYPDGVEVVQTVALTQNRLGAAAVEPKPPAPEGLAGPATLSTTRLPGPRKDRERVRRMVYPDEATTIRFKRVWLEIPAGAVAAPVEITIEALAEEDLARLDAGMLNVTADDAGYRLLPEGLEFKKPVRLGMPYDRQLMPTGLPEDQTVTYYNQNPEDRWHQLKKLGEDRANAVVVSETTHFTDMINATLVLPEHPTPLAYNPTSIKDIKAADPGARINLVEAPAATPTGDARVTYPIEVPPARQGVGPELSLTYNSSSGNGWLGTGWDLAISAVTIETRWGVARYSATHETETYVLDGDQLAPVAHRGEPSPRLSPKTFHARVEGAFRRIVRHGTSPSTYWWEVTDKDGTRHFYGGTPEGGQNLAALLADPAAAPGAGPVFKWLLRETRDPNGNTVTYSYATVTDAGVGDGRAGVPGVQAYPREIRYTGHNGTPGAYVVRFLRDRELTPGARRPDVTIDSRPGFKVVTADLLRRIEIRYRDQLVRGYTLEYREGAFKKTLLASVTQFGAGGPSDVFHTHAFDYYDEVRNADGSYGGFAPAAPWDTGGDGIKGGFLVESDASALNGTPGTSVGGHMYVGINVGQASKQNSFGFKVGYSRSRSSANLMLMDVNGDGLPDKVFRKDGRAFYRLNRSGPGGTTTFGPPVEVPSLPAIAEEQSETTTAGAEAFPGGGSVMADVSQTFTTSTAYFTDVNGDGRTDVVRDGQVYFGYLDADGRVAYSPNSADTPAPIGTGAIDPTDLVEDLSAIYEERIDNFPLLDSVRTWEAPFDGTVRVTGSVALLEDTSPERAAYKTADGVRVAIQHRGAERWSTTIAADDYAPKTPTGVEAIPVARGERLYFRVQSVFDGAFDLVAWDPQVRYVGVPSGPADVNGRDPYAYGSAADFVLAGRAMPVVVPFAGTVRVAGNLVKTGVTTDDVAVQVLRNGLPVLTRSLAWDATGQIPLSDDFTVAARDRVELRVRVDSPVDLTRIDWTPQLFYVAAPSGVPVTDPDGNFLVQLRPAYDADLYPANDLTAPQGSYRASRDGTLLVTPVLVVNGALVGPTPRQLTFTVKARGALKAKRAVQVRRDPVTGEIVVDAGALPIAVPVVEDEELFFDFSSRDVDFGGLVLTHAVTVRYHDVPPDPDGTFPETPVASAIHYATTPGAFPQTYRGWAAIGYNGNRDRAARPIDEAVLVLTDSYRLETARFYLFTPVPEARHWRGPDDLAWIAAGRTSSSRLGIDYIQVPRPEDFAGLRAPSRVSRARQIAAGGGIGGASASTAFGTSQPVVEYMDLNGDQYPDVLGNGGAQFTEMRGGLEGARRDVAGLGDVRENENFSATIGYGGTVPQNKPDGRGDVGSQPGTSNGGVNGNQGPELPPLGFSGDLTAGTSTGKADLLDVNGDGLPDRVFEGGDVALNLGYRFADREPWSFSFVNEGESLGASIGGNTGFNDGIYGFGGGLSLSRTISESDRSLTDVNGDGLLDIVEGGGSTLTVRLNTGSGFAPAVPWRGGRAAGLADNRTTSQGGGAYFTIAINIPLTPVFIILNPGDNANLSMARQDSALRDVNGDGYPDHVTSTSDGEMTVALNRTGRTNLLKSVARPLGATITLSYERSGNTVEHPQSRWVLSGVEVDDGHPGDGVDVLASTYTYEGGFFDRFEREFYGYRTVTETRGDGSQVVQEFNNRDYTTRALLAKVLTRDGDGRLFLKTEHRYEVRPVADGSAFPARTRTATFFYQRLTADEAAYGATTAEELDYDAFGNVTLMIDRADAGPEDDVYARIGYLARLDTYLVGRPTSIAVTDFAGRLVRQRRGDYDARGNLVRVERTLVGGVNPVHTMTYDEFGNLASLVDPKGYTLEYAYDPEVRTHVVRIQDSFGYVSTASHDLRFGLQTSTVDVAGNPTTYAYDSFGRLIAVHGPYDVGSDVPTLQMTYRHGAHPARAVTSQKEHDSPPTSLDMTLDMVTVIDGANRIIQTRKEAEVEGPGGPVYGMTVTGKAMYDERGRVVQQGQAVFEPGHSLAYSATVPLRNPTRFSYDALGRTLQTVTPDGATTRTQYDFEDGRLRTTVTDAEGQVRHSLKDVSDKIVGVHEVLGGQVYRTSYVHSILNELVEIVDAEGNRTGITEGHRTVITYDTLGRRTAIDSPDSGKTEFRYDASDNVVAKITANLQQAGQQITYLYDFNRLREIRYPETPAVTYEYGQPGALDNRAGRITRITDETGSEDRFYGKLGEITKSVKTVASETGPKPEVYATEMEFDSFGRLRRLVYPDGEVLTYGYDRGGLLESAIGEKRGNRYTYVRHVGYDEFAQQVRMQLGNLVETRYQYDPLRRWLTALTTRTASGKVLQSLTYQYDRVGNVRGARNETPVQRFGSVTLGLVEQTYHYDGLHRLVEASGRFEFAPGKTSRYTSLFTYDSIHNLRNKIQTHTIDQPSGSGVEQRETTYSLRFDYTDPKKPHAATKDGERTYQYDASGNLVRWDDNRSGQRRELQWTEENRLRAVTDNGRTTTFRYNADGERVIKRGRFGETVWVNQYFTVRNAEVATKHVFAGPTRVASQLVRQGGSPGRPVSRAPANDSQARRAPAGVEDDVIALAAATSTTATPEVPPTLGRLARAAAGPALAAPVSVTPAEALVPGVGRDARAGTRDARGLLVRDERDAPGRGPAALAETGQGPTGPPPGQAKKDEAARPGAERGGRPEWAGPHDTRGIDRALEAGRGRKVGLHRRDGEEPPPGRGRGKSSPAIEGPYRPQEFQLFFYHGDHLGSSTVVTDAYADVFEHVEYFPAGEAWVDQGGTATLLPYRFTSKELDPETGLYYFGARYYDPRLQRWLSPDPALEAYLDGNPNAGVYLPANLALYTYALNNPVRLSDPSGEFVTGGLATLGGAVLGGAISAGIAIWQGQEPRAVAGAFVHGAIAGAMMGMVIDTAGASLPALAAAGALSNAAGGIAGRLVAGQPTTATTVASDLATGAVGAVGGAAVAKGIGVAARAIGSRLTAALGREATEGAVTSSTRAVAGRTTTAVGGRAAGQVGAAGEEAVSAAIGLPRNIGPGRVTIPGTGRGGFRIPDFGPEATLALRGSIVEVKNVAQLRITQQLRDLANYAQARGGVLEIFTNGKIPKTGELADLIERGLIVIRQITE